MKNTHQSKNIGVTVLQRAPVTRWRWSTHFYSIIADPVLLICSISLISP